MIVLCRFHAQCENGCLVQVKKIGWSDVAETWSCEFGMGGGELGSYGYKVVYSSTNRGFPRIS